MDAVGLSLLEGYCVRPSYIRWYVVIRVVLSLQQLQLDLTVFSVRYSRATKCTWCNSIVHMVLRLLTPLFWWCAAH